MPATTKPKPKKGEGKKQHDLRGQTLLEGFGLPAGVDRHVDEVSAALPLTQSSTPQQICKKAGEDARGKR